MSMTTRAAFVLATVAALSACATTAAPEQETLVGAWRLQTYVDTPDGGAPIYTFGKHPVGLFTFSADGHLSVSIMRNPPEPDSAIADPDPDACVPEWYCSYFGTYTVDWAAHRWTVRVEGGNIPSFIGTEQTRAFSLDGDRLILTERYEDEDGRIVRTERILLRGAVP